MESYRSVGLAPPERQPLTGIDVLVVGAGLGGLFAAVELYRQGHFVRVIESKSQVEGLGKLIKYHPPGSGH